MIRQTMKDIVVLAKTWPDNGEIRRPAECAVLVADIGMSGGLH